MSSPTRRSQSADPLERNKLHEAIADLSRVSSTTSDIFLDCEETDDGLMAVLKNIQYCLHKALTKSSAEQLKMADRLLKKDCNKNLEQAIRQERSAGEESHLFNDPKSLCRFIVSDVYVGNSVTGYHSFDRLRIGLRAWDALCHRSNAPRLGSCICAI